MVSGQRAGLSVVASSGVTKSFQWYQELGQLPEGLIAGATNSTYVTPPLTSTSTYWVTISNSAGSVTSDPATVTVVDSAPRLGLELISGLPVLTLDGPVGVTHRIDFSHDLASWTNLVEVELSVSPFTFIDVQATNVGERYYRAVVP